ncbi:MAG: type II toxin-antitoxin system VapB family antitoxin [Candidatus Bipolaricaulia bacterium]
MARMTVTIDDQLLAKARELSGAKTKKETLEIALREFVSRFRRREIVAHAGTIELTLTQEELHRRREKH